MAFAESELRPGACADIRKRMMKLEQHTQTSQTQTTKAPLLCEGEVG